MKVLAKPLIGTVEVPGDKSISHRALLLGAMAKGTTTFSGLSPGEDVLSTIRCLQQLGLDANEERIHGGTFREPACPLNCGNSGTTMRLLMGLLSAQPFSSTCIGDSSLSRRPMNRVAAPLRMMGADIKGSYAPIEIRGKTLKAIDHQLPIASAQIKSALLIAGLFAEGKTRLSGKIHSRNHTEEMLRDFGVRVIVAPDYIEIEGGQQLTPCHVSVSGDPSSAAFFAAAAAMIPGSNITIKNVCTNPTRMQFFQLLKRMGAKVIIGKDIKVENASLNGVKIEHEEIPFLIDELPLVGILGVFANGTTEVIGAKELRLKESDRIHALCVNLSAMGARVEQFEEGFRIQGPQKLRGAVIDSFHDHRIAMGFAVASLAAEGETRILNREIASISYPSFYKDLARLCG